MTNNDINVELSSGVFSVKGLSESDIQKGISLLMTYSFQEGLVLDIDGETAVYIDRDKGVDTYTVSAYFRRP
jgi:hypothetical protein